MEAETERSGEQLGSDQPAHLVIPSSDSHAKMVGLTQGVKTLGSLPIPQPDLDLYHRILRAGFLRHPRRMLNYLLAKYYPKAAWLPYLPTKLDIEPLSRCNFRCTMCPVSDWQKGQRGADMSFEDYKKLIDSQWGLVEIKLQGLGEPLLARDVFFEMIRYARKKDIWVRTVTNGSLLHLNDNYKRLIDSDPCEVQVSIDGASKETFEKIRRGSKFDRVTENCGLLNAYCNEKGVNRTRMWTVIQKDNIHEFLDFVPHAARMGFPRMTYALYLSSWGNEQWNDTNTKLQAKSHVTRELALRAIELGKELGVSVSFYSGERKYAHEPAEDLCYWPFQRAYVSSDLRIVPCCVIANPDFYELGDASDFTKSWNSTTFQEFRRAHMKGEIPKACQDCYQPCYQRDSQQKNGATKQSLPVVGE